MRFTIVRQMRDLILLLIYIQIQHTHCQNIMFPPIPQLPQISLSIPDPFQNFNQAFRTPREEFREESELLRCNSEVWNTFFNQGLRLAVASMKSRLPEGIPEYGIPPMEPLELGALSLEISQDPIEMNASLTNLNVWGLTSFTRDTWFLDVNTRILDMSVVIPNILTTGMFTMFPNGQVGNMSITFDSVTIKAKIKLAIVKSGNPGQTAIKVDGAVSEMKYEKVRIRTSDIFPEENEKLNYAVEVFTERYSELLFNEVKPFVSREMDKVIIKISDAVLNSEMVFVALPANGVLPGLDLSTLSGFYDRARNALQLPSVVRRSDSYRSVISLLVTAFTGCRQYSDVTDVLTRPFNDFVGGISS